METDSSVKSTVQTLTMIIIIVLTLSIAILLSIFHRWLNFKPPAKKRLSFNPILPDAYQVQPYFKSSILTSEFPSPPRDAVLPEDDDSLPYVLRVPFLDEHEQALFKQLEKLLPKPYRLLTKVRLATLLEVSADLKVRHRQAKRERLRQKQVDFVLCERENWQVVGAIILERDNLEQDFQTQIHDKFVEMALAAAHLPVLHLSVNQSYSLETLRELLSKTFLLERSVLKKRSCEHVYPSTELSTFKELTTRSELYKVTFGELFSNHHNGLTVRKDDISTTK